MSNSKEMLPRLLSVVQNSEVDSTVQPQGPRIGDAPPHSRHCDGDTDMALFHKLQVSEQKFSCWKSTKTIAFFSLSNFPTIFLTQTPRSGSEEPFYIRISEKITLTKSYRFPRVFGDEFGDEFGDSLNFVSKMVTHLVMISVNHRIW